ncbi:MAG: Ig-like domain-containing protein [Prevotella sp.]|nr:Ig-like domain-containing protein [Prevotella sp.]
MNHIVLKLAIFLVCMVGVCTKMHASAKAGEAVVKVGATATISLASAYQNTLLRATNVTATWSTSSTNISITSRTNTSCTIKGVTAGTAQVNYYCSYYIDGYYRTMDFYYTVTIESSGSSATITLTPSSITLYEGDTYQISAYQPGYVGGVYFTTSNSSVATVSNSSSSGYYTYGTVTAGSAGTTYIYAKSATGATSSACTVTVKTKTVTPTSIYLPGSKSIEEGEYAYITATVSPSNATYSLTWSSNNTDVATVNSSGRVYGKSPGVARITAKVNGYSISDYCDVTVTAKQVVATSISADGPETMALGETYQLSPSCSPDNATVSFQYSSDHSEVVTVSTSGLLTAVGVGEATITVTETLSGKTATINVNVTETAGPETDLSTLDNVVYIGKVNVCVGELVTLSVKMKNTVPIQGFGFDLYLPDGVTIAKDEDGFNRVTLSTERTTEKKTNYFDSNIMADGALRVLASSTGGYIIDGNDGEIVKIVVAINDEMEEGFYPIILKNIVLTDSEANGYETDMVKTTLAVVNKDTDISSLDNVVYIEKTEGRIGSQQTLSVKMKNTAEIQGFGFDLYLPEGVTVAKDEDGFNRVSLSTERTTEKKTDYFDSNIMADGALRVLASSTGGYTISGTDGEIVQVVVNISETMEEGDYPVILKEIALSDNNSQGYETAYVKSTLTVSSYTPGDVDGNGKINVVDFTAIANYILGKAPAGFIEKAADVSGDGKANVVDLTAVANIILYGRATEN